MKCRTKTRYPSKEEADRDLAIIRKKSTREIKPVKSYLCDECKFYHLTSISEYLPDKVKNLEAIIIEKDEEIKRIKTEHHRESNKAAQVDSRVVALNNKIAKQNRLIKIIRKSTSELITKLLQYERKMGGGTES